MKRSLINNEIVEALELFNKYNIHLPRFGYYTSDDFEMFKNHPLVIENELGWDVTDFGYGDYENKGLLLFTVRNGNLKDLKKTYAEKYLVVKEKQITPLHYHWDKTEDIINKNGGVLVIQFYNSKENDELDVSDVTIEKDGGFVTIPAGGTVKLYPGESVTIEPRVYHSFWAEEATVIVGEVSKTNDDHNDNNFFDKTSRFTEVEEDEDVKYLLCNEYNKIEVI